MSVKVVQAHHHKFANFLWRPSGLQRLQFFYAPDIAKLSSYRGIIVLVEEHVDTGTWNHAYIAMLSPPGRILGTHVSQ